LTQTQELVEVKRYLGITWNDTDTDSNLSEFISNGKEYLNEIAGTELNFSENGLAKSLLKDYVRYAYNHSLEMFETNFKRLLLKLSIREGVRARATTTETPS